MISETGNNPDGFSLLELVISLALVSLMVGFFVVHIPGKDTGRELNEFRYELERFVVKTSRSGNAFGEDRVITVSSEKLQSDGEELAVPATVELSVQRSKGGEFNRPDPFDWVFHPGGLIEPLRFRLESESTSVVLSFDPLTARPVAE
ncbi:MAG: prepilin-type N-terminal cleavage/methylation domain-containing protein [Verrucomicrobiales bacterium]|nr:prepilin-type N-terminal cleavage/methylation domain-containing protein [Verrucomicrobiales bacterium]